MNTPKIHFDEIKISNSNNEMQLDVIYNFLKDSYWAKDIPKEFVEKSIENSLCFGAFIRLPFSVCVTQQH